MQFQIKHPMINTNKKKKILNKITSKKIEKEQIQTKKWKKNSSISMKSLKLKKTGTPNQPS